jgi:hypothetical protein
MTDAPIQQRPGPGPVGTEEHPGAVATAAHETKAHAGELAHEAAGEVRGVAETAKDQARTLASGAREQIAREAGDATNRAADALASTARDLGAMASGQGAPDSPAADVVREIGQRVERTADQLRERGYQGLMDDVSRWARAHPGTFLVAAAGAGFAVGRLFRSVDTGAVMDAARDGAGLESGNGADQMASPPPLAPELTAAELDPLAPGQVGGTVGITGDPAGMTPSTPGQPASIDLTDDPSWRAAPTTDAPGGSTSGTRP